MNDTMRFDRVADAGTADLAGLAAEGAGPPDDRAVGIPISAGAEPEIVRWVAELQDGIEVERNAERIFKREFRRIVGFFLRRGCPRQEAEDLAQEAFFRAFGQLDTLRDRSRFREWLVAIAINVFRNELRRRSRHKRDGHDVPLEDREDHRPSAHVARSRETPPDRSLHQRELRAAVSTAVEGLPPQMRQCFALRLDHGMKYREIALVMKISIETVKAHIHQARRRLRIELGEWFGEAGGAG